MGFPPYFLDQLRERVALADLIGRRVRLVRKGREHAGLCPFHNERTPSFTVNEEKGFYHCFGCGAHGDIFGFVMRTEGLGFPETVRRLADEAGVAVPEETPEDRARAQRQASLYQVMERACLFFETSLGGAAGRGARDYLDGRGLDQAACDRFRLGYAPDGRGALKSALMGADITEAQLIEGGLLIRPDGGGASYDRFRGRVMFPIADRRGRVIAFGARALGDGQPKYLNSPETPLFHKGNVLYGLATAWQPARDRGRVVVAEGYMDVIALARAGIDEAVAPLGTALTEAQIELLWKLAPEPVLCFDGDAAGLRAAGRAAERALPLLKPGCSLRFVTLPAGEDPDTLLRARGVAAMEELIAAARPLDQVIWAHEAGGAALDTPERIAGLEARLETAARRIDDAKVQYQYRAAFRARLRAATRPAGRKGAPFGKSGFTRGGDAGNWPRGMFPASLSGSLPAPLAGPGPEGLDRRRAQALTATLIAHWGLLDEFGETFGALEFSDPELDKLRQEILLLYAANPDLDSEAVRRHLKATGFSDGLAAVFAPDVLVHAGFARGGADVAAARGGILQLIERFRQADWRAQRDEAERAYGDDPTEENWSRLQQSMLTLHQHHSEADAPGSGATPITETTNSEG